MHLSQPLQRCTGHYQDGLQAMQDPGKPEAGSLHLALGKGAAY